MNDHDRLIYRVVDGSRTVHSSLGPGFVESIYGRALTWELRAGGLHVDRERLIKVWYAGSVVGRHRLDLVVAHTVIVELKAGRTLIPVHTAQLRSYLHASGLSLGLLLNFGTTEVQWEVVRE